MNQKSFLVYGAVINDSQMLDGIPELNQNSSSFDKISDENNLVKFLINDTDTILVGYVMIELDKPIFYSIFDLQIMVLTAEKYDLNYSLFGSLNLLGVSNYQFLDLNFDIHLVHINFV